jgi:lycopene cyclase domain-containing protein
VTYLAVLFLVLIVTLITNRLLSIKVYPKVLFSVVLSLTFVIVGTIWDSYSVSQGHWFFNEESLIGIKLGILPIEEYLFFIVVPYFCISVYKLMEKRFN